VKNLLKSSTHLFFRRQTSILSAALIMMVLMLFSRVLGLIRNWVLAGRFGAGNELDIYNAAFVLPDLLANILITGALSVAFIPVFTTLIADKKEKEAWEMGSTLINASVFIYLVLSVVFIIFAPQLSRLLVPGFTTAQQDEVANITRLLVFAELFLICGSFLTSVLQSYHRFIVSAMAPVVYNLGIILGIIWLSPYFGIYGVVMGVIIGAIMHFLIQLPIARGLGYRYRFVLNLTDWSVLKVARLSLPRAIGVGLAQLEWVVSVFLASFSIAGSVTVLKFASDLQNFPIGLFGMAIATASLPTLSSEWATNNLKDFKQTFLSSLHQILYLAVPMSVILMVLRIPVVRLALGSSGKFTWEDTVLTAVTLSFFAVGVFGAASYLLVARAFYAMHDTLTPLRVSVISLLLHILISTFFVSFVPFEMRVIFIAISTSITSIVAFLLSLFILSRRVGGFGTSELYLPALKIFVASVVMGVVLYLPLHVRFYDRYVIDYIIDTTRTLNLLALTLAVGFTGLVVYLLLTWWFRSEELKTFLKMLDKLRGWQKAFRVGEQIDGEEKAVG
jgi:putative peptidoglycan lipid II flippase